VITATYTVIPTAPPTRITLLDANGTPAVRWTLQTVEREGRRLRWRPEGQLHTLGSATAHRRAWAHRGFRQELGLRWGHGLQSTREAWAGADWAAPELRLTAEAHSEILGWAAPLEVSVEPFLGTAMPTFKAKAFEEGPSLQDTKGFAHPHLELVLAATALVNKVVFEQAAVTGGWGIGPWGLLPWGH